MSWTWRPWRRKLVSPEDRAQSHRAVEEAPRLAARAAAATRDLILVTGPNHLGERYHRALTGK